MTEELKEFFMRHPGTPAPKYHGSVRKSPCRLEMAQQQARLTPATIEKIIEVTNCCLKKIGLTECIQPQINTLLPIDYQKIKADNGLADKRDIVWMKFTTDGYLGVVATSNDINFDIPQSSKDYNKRTKWHWKHNTSGILVHQLEKEWDKSFVPVFPLPNIPAGLQRGDIERAIGNYLIFNNVPIIDFYSHNY